LKWEGITRSFKWEGKNGSQKQEGKSGSQKQEGKSGNQKWEGKSGNQDNMLEARAKSDGPKWELAVKLPLSFHFFGLFFVWFCCNKDDDLLYV